MKGHPPTMFSIKTRQLAMRAKRLPQKAKLGLGISLMGSFGFYAYVFYTLNYNYLQEETFLGLDSCPACYGKSFCEQLLSQNVTFDGWSRLRFLDFVNVNNIYYAKKGAQNIVLKKLGRRDDLAKLSQRICVDAGYDERCDPSRAIYQTRFAREKEANPSMVKELSPSLVCASQRLVDRLISYYIERERPDEFNIHDRAQLISTLMINPEPVLFQAFPAVEGFPFARYLGACGRFVAEEYVGPFLSEFYDSPWQERIDYAYQLIHMAELLTNNELGFSFYLPEVEYNHFAVNSDGKIIIVNTKNIVVVDKAKMKRDKPAGFTVPLYSQHNVCPANDETCKPYEPKDFCTHNVVDHNYYYVCRNILSDALKGPEHPGALLHDLPVELEAKWPLQALVAECVQPTAKDGRLKAKNKLFTTLQEIRRDHF